MTGLRFTLLIITLGGASAFAPAKVSPMMVSSTRGSHLQMGVLDDLKFLFGEEGKKARKELEEKEKREQEEAQRAIFERRRNPELMEEYEANVKKRRNTIASEKTKLEAQQESFFVDEEK